MKTKKIIYWIATGLFSLWMLLNAYFYLTSEEAKRIFTHFGFPDYFRIELAITKLIGVAALLLTIIKGRLKEWAYVGFVIVVISGFIAHLSSGDSFSSSSSALVAMALLMASYYTYHQLEQIKIVSELITN